MAIEAPSDWYRSNFGRPARRGRRWLGPLVVVAVLLAGGTVQVLWPLQGSPPAEGGGKALPGPPIDAAGGGGRLWVLACAPRCTGPAAEGQLVQIDARTGRVLSRTAAPSPQALAVGGDAAWTLDFEGGKVSHIAAATGERVGTTQLRLPAPIVDGDRDFLPFDVAVGAGAVWVSTARGYVARIDPTTDRVDRLIRLEPKAPGAILARPGGVWVAEDLLGVLRIDPFTASTSLLTIEAADGRRLSVGDLALADGGIWAAGTWARGRTSSSGHTGYVSTDRAAIARIDLRSRKLARITPLPERLVIVGAGGRHIWLAQWPGRNLYGLHTTSGRLGRTPLRERGFVLAVSRGTVWLAAENHRLYRQTLAP
jgi:hypothetical protein